MPERPLLHLGPVRVERRTPGTPRRPPAPITPPTARQIRRISPQIQRLEEILGRDDAALLLQADPSLMAPERALVFEVAGSLTSFAAQAERVGFKFLGESDVEFDPDEDFYFADDAGGRLTTKKVTATLYLVMPDLRAMRELLRLWAIYCEGRDFERNYGQWKALFEQLHTIRPWGAEDRLTTGFRKELTRWLSGDRRTPFRFEVNLWYSDSADRRHVARTGLVHSLGEIGGQILHESEIIAIRYHGLLAEIPPDVFAEGEDVFLGQISNLDPVMHYFPQAMSAAEQYDDGTAELNCTPPVGIMSACAALIDGYPFSNHSLLTDRLDIEDIFEIEERSQAANRFHGTSMASLILHGCSSDESQMVNNKLLVIPVLHPDPGNPSNEIFPPDKLAIDLVHQAVLKVKEKQDEAPENYRSIAIINHSLGNINDVYCGKISHWGKLLDYLSYTFGYLFIVSAGNYTHPVKIRQFSTLIEFEAATLEQKRDAIYRAIAEDVQYRQVLSPAEAINPVVVGGWHSGASPEGTPPARLFDIFPGEDGPSVATAIGLGHKRTVKPDMFYDSGKVYCSVSTSGGCCVLLPALACTSGGLTVAGPSGRGMQTASSKTFGTSCAAALVTNKAITISNTLDDLAREAPESAIPMTHKAVMIKALLTHGCSWESLGQHLEQTIEPRGSHKHSARRTNIARMLGFGRPDIDRVIESTAKRATMIAHGTIIKDQKHIFTIPLPSSMSNRRDKRRLTATLSWFSPVNSRNLQYRQAVLELDVPDHQCGTERKSVIQPPSDACNRGTLVHGVFEGKKALPLDQMYISISCREQAGGLDDPIPYAIAVSFETLVDANVNIYDEIRTKLEVMVRTRVPV